MPRWSAAAGVGAVSFRLIMRVYTAKSFCRIVELCPPEGRGAAHSQGLREERRPRSRGGIPPPPGPFAPTPGLLSAPPGPAMWSPPEERWVPARLARGRDAHVRPVGPPTPDLPGGKAASPAALHRLPFQLVPLDSPPPRLPGSGRLTCVCVSVCGRVRAGWAVSC